MMSTEKRSPTRYANVTHNSLYMTVDTQMGPTFTTYKCLHTKTESLNQKNCPLTVTMENVLFHGNKTNTNLSSGLSIFFFRDYTPPIIQVVSENNATIRAC